MGRAKGHLSNKGKEPAPVTLSTRYVARLSSNGLRIQSLDAKNPFHLTLSLAEAYLLESLLYDHLHAIMETYQAEMQEHGE